MTTPAAQTFHFTHRWVDEGAPEAVVDRFADLASFPDWWREVRRVERVDDDTARVVIRSRLPISLRLTLTREVEDRPAGALRVGIEGDLTGYAALVVRPDGAGGSCVEYDQTVDVTQPVLRRLVRLPGARAVLAANHGAMMRRAQRRPRTAD